MNNIIGNNIKQCRLAKGLRQADLAAMIGKDTTSIVRYESGTTDIPSSVLLDITKALDVTLNDLVEDVEE
jgi:transcriptional regulator with XRE-family HTH domain